jgi:hypothetical protein
MSNIEIKITAETTQLQAQLAIAKAQFAQTQKALNDLAKEAQKNGLSDGLKADMAKASEAMLAAKNNVTGLTKEMKTASGGAHEFGGAIGALESVLGPLVGFLSVESVIRFGEANLEAAAHIEHEAQVLSMASTAYQAFSESARLAQVDTGLVEMALRKFNAVQGAALEGTNAQSKAFRELGVDASLPAEEAIPAVARALLDLQNEAEKARLETELFGKSGEELNPVLEQWARGTGDLKKQLSDLGVILDPTVTKAAEETEGKFTEFFDRMKTQWTPAAVALSGALADILEFMQEDPAAVNLPLGHKPSQDWSGSSGNFGGSSPGAQFSRTPEQVTEQADVARLIDLDAKMAQRQKLTEDIAKAQKTLNEAQAQGDTAGVKTSAQAVADLKKQLDDLDKDHGADKARKGADQLVQIYAQSNLKRIEGEQATNQFLYDMGQRSLDEFTAQAKKLENDRYAIELDGLKKKEAIDRSNANIFKQDMANEAVLAQEHANRLTQIEQQAQQKKRQIALTDLQDFISEEDARLEAAKEAFSNELKNHQITEQKEHDLEVALTKAIEAEILRRFDAEHAGLVKGTDAYAQAMKQRQAIVQQFDKSVQKANDALVTEQMEKWHQLSQSIFGSVNSAIHGVMFQGDTFGQFMSNLAIGIADSFLQMGEKILEDQIENWVMTEILGKASATTTADAAIMASAAEAAAAAFASTAAIPIVGPELAPGAAAAAYAAVMSMTALASAAGGQYNVPFDGQITELHRNEMVLPASIASPMREYFAGGKGGGGISVHFAPVIHGNVNAETRALIDKMPGQLVAALKKARRLGVPVNGR